MNCIQITIESKIARVILNRPDKRNALNRELIDAIPKSFKSLSENPEVRVIILSGSGKAFCAGADINYMKEIAGYGKEENEKDSLRLSGAFRSIYECSKPVIARVHGAAIGGANGLLAACDLAYCTSETKFAFSEVKLGITPATISPFVINRIGQAHARDLMLTGRLFDGREAERTGLVNRCFATEKELDNWIEEITAHLLSAGQQAVETCKDLIHTVSKEPISEKLYHYTAEMIAGLRATEDAQQRMKAFLGKTKGKNE